jgi:CheY-specific phosphatase CheX
MSVQTKFSALDREIAAVMEVVAERTITFFREQLSLRPTGVDCRMHHEKSLQLRGVTAIVAVGTTAGLYIAYSYDEALIRAITKRHTAGISFSPDEADLYMRETASDVVNIIIGNCTSDLAQRGELISLSPPVLMEGARTIQGRSDSTIAALTLSFADGALDVAFVGPKILFDDQLSFFTFQEGAA